MIDGEIYADRARRLAKGGPFLAAGRENMIYLSGTDAALFVVITGRGEPVLLTSRMEVGRARRQSYSQEVIAFQRSRTRLLEGEVCVFDSAAGALKGILGERGIDEIRFDSLSEKVFHDLSPLGLKRSRAVEEMRVLKSREEIELIREARRVIGEVYDEVSSGLDDGITELAVAGRIISSVMSRGAESAFDPIVGFDENSAMPHGKPGRKALSGASVILLDLGARVGGYCSDITRTVARTPAARRDLEAVKNVVEEVADSMEVGMKLSEADSHARESLGADSALMTHGLGHGLGLAVHEGPILAPGSDDVLRDGMVFTIEPGVYREGKHGIRWEEDYICWGGGVEPVL